MNATTVSLTTTQPEGKVVKKSITYINPTCVDTDTARFIAALNELSQNDLTKIEKISRTDLDIPEV